MTKHDDDTIAYCLKNGITYNAFGVMRGCLFTDPTVAALAKKYKTSAAQASHASHAQRHSTRPACCMMLSGCRVLRLLEAAAFIASASSRSFRLCVC